MLGFPLDPYGGMAGTHHTLLVEEKASSALHQMQSQGLEKDMWWRTQELDKAPELFEAQGGPGNLIYRKKYTEKYIKSIKY